MAFADEALLSRAEGQLEAEVNGEVVLMSIERGTYYGLDEIGSDIWHRLAEPTRFADLCRALAGSYDAAPDVIARDVEALLVELRDQGLIRIG